jgi:hypothetical protein
MFFSIVFHFGFVVGQIVKAFAVQEVVAIVVISP